MRKISLTLLLLVGLFEVACGGYDAADPSEVEPRVGEVAGVLVNSKGDASPNATIQLYSTSGTTPIVSYTGIDSNGLFGVFPPETGTYNIVGIFGDVDTASEKAILQNVSFTMNEKKNIGTLAAQKVGLLTVQVATPDGIDPEGVKLELIGYEGSTTTIQEGYGAIARGIPAGTYKVAFSKESLETLTIDDVIIKPGETTHLGDVELQVKK